MATFETTDPGLLNSGLDRYMQLVSQAKHLLSEAYEVIRNGEIIISRGDTGLMTIYHRGEIINDLESVILHGKVMLGTMKKVRRVKR